MIRNPPKKPKPAFENVEVNNGKCSSAMELVTEYTANGTLHGINYMGDRERHWLERYLSLKHLEWNKTKYNLFKNLLGGNFLHFLLSMHYFDQQKLREMERHSNHHQRRRILNFSIWDSISRCNNLSRHQGKHFWIWLATSTNSFATSETWWTVTRTSVWFGVRMAEYLKTFYIHKILVKVEWQQWCKFVRGDGSKV